METICLTKFSSFCPLFILAYSLPSLYSLCFLRSCSFHHSGIHETVWQTNNTKKIVCTLILSLCPSVLSLTLNDRCLFAPFSFLIDKLSHDDQIHSVETHEHFSLSLFLFLSLPLTVQAATIESEDFVVHLPSK